MSHQSSSPTDGELDNLLNEFSHIGDDSKKEPNLTKRLSQNPLSFTDPGAEHGVSKIDPNLHESNELFFDDFLSSLKVAPKKQNSDSNSQPEPETPSKPVQLQPTASQQPALATAKAISVDLGPYTELLTSRGSANLFFYLQKGAVFWKSGKFGLPHFLLFRLDSQNKYLQWYSRNKTLPKTRISLSAIRSIKIGNNRKFEKHCNDRLLKRSLEICLEDTPQRDPIYFNSAACPSSYYNSDLQTPSILSTKSHIPQYTVKQNKDSLLKSKRVVESIDIVSLNSVNFLIWGRAFTVFCNFNNKISKKQSESSWDLTGFIKEISDINININLPQELVDKAYLLHRFEFFAAVHYNKKFNVQEAKITKIEEFTMDEIHQQAEQIRRGIIKINKKLSVSKKLTPKEKEEINDRLYIIESDFKIVKENYLRFGFTRTRKIYWLMYAELIAMNEWVIAIGSTVRSRNNYKLM